MRGLVWDEGTNVVWWGSLHTRVPGRRQGHPSSRPPWGRWNSCGRSGQLKKQIAVTPRSSIPPGDMGKPGTECVAPGGGWLHLIDISRP